MHQLRNHPAYRYVVLLLLVAFMVILALQVSRLRHAMAYGAPGTNDFIEYWSAGQLLLTGRHPYDFNALHKLQVSLGSKYSSPIIMWNPPWLLVWILPLLWLPFETAALVWLIGNIGLVMLCGSVVWRTLAPASVRGRIGTAWVATLLFVPALFTVRMGQMSTLLLVGVAGFLYGMERRKPFLAGMFLALTTIKPHVVYLLWIAVAYWVLARRDWRLVGGIGVAISASLIALTAIWPEWLTGYRQAIAQPPLYWASPTAGTLLRLFVFRNWAAAQFLPPIVIGFLFTLYLVIRRPDFKWRRVISPLLLVSVPTAAYGWTFDQIVLLVPYLLIISGLVRDEPEPDPRSKRVVISGLVSIGVMMVIQNKLGVNEFFFFWVPWALGIVYVYMQAVYRPAGEASLSEMAGAAPLARRL